MSKAKLESYLITLDDDPIVARSIQAHTGIRSLAFKSSKDLQAHGEIQTPTAVFVDVHLGQDENGIDLIPAIKTRWPYTPIIVITSDLSGDAVGQALAAGAHDFIRKPIEPRELTARLRARSVEMSERNSKDNLVCGDIVLNISLNELVGPSGSQHISPSDSRLLQYLIQSKGLTVSRQELKRRIWGNVRVSENALDQKLHDVRKALRETGSQLKLNSIYRQGFILTALHPGESAA